MVWRSRRATGLALGILTFGLFGVAIYVHHQGWLLNLPVAANVDERQGLALLYGFEKEGLNPHFFHYPTFYYYLTWLLLKPWAIGQSLLLGRILNSVFVLLTAVSAAWMAHRFARSKLAAWLAGTLTATSPILATSAGYLGTDVLLAALTTFALISLERYRRTGERRAWWISLVLVGLALSTKYTAVMLIAVYICVEWLRGREAGSVRGHPSTMRLAGRSLQSHWSVVLLTVGAVLTLAGWLAGPGALQTVFQGSGGINATWNDADLHFVESMASKFLVSALVLSIGAALLQRRPSLRPAFPPSRVASALLVVFWSVCSHQSILPDRVEVLPLRLWIGAQGERER